jgi:hypothetical protein
VVDGLVVEHVRGDDLLDDLLLDLLSELFGGDVLAVLGGDNDGVNAERDNGTAVMCVLNSNLGLGVGPQPGEATVLAGGGHCRVQLVREEDGKRKELGGLVGGISEHDALVTGTELLESLLVVQTLGNVGRLLLNGNEDVAGLVVEALVGRVVANVLDGIADDLLVVEVCLGGDLTEDHDHTGLGGRLTGHLGERVLLEAGIEDGVRDLIAADTVSSVRESRASRAEAGYVLHPCLSFGDRQTVSRGIGGKREGGGGGGGGVGGEHTRSCRGGPRQQTRR